MFAKYAEAERRRRARAMTAALDPVPVTTDALDDVAHKQHKQHKQHGGAVDPEDIAATAVVGTAFRAAASAAVPLVILQGLPMLVAAGLGAGAAVVRPGLSVWRRRPGPRPS